MSLQEKIEEINKQSAEQVPQEMQEVFQRAIEELRASGKAEDALGVGDTAPSFSLPDTEGNTVSSDELLREGPLVVTFYRGVW